MEPVLAGYVELVGYELAELVHDAAWLVDWTLKTTADQTLKNAMLEAELLHARCLIEFLLNKPQDDRNVKARDFAPGWKAPNRKELTELYDKICAHLSHLGKDRLKAKEVWTPAVIVGLILDAVEDLAGNLGNASHEERLRELIEGARRMHLHRIASSVVSTSTQAISYTQVGSTGPPPLPGGPA